MTIKEDEVDWHAQYDAATMVAAEWEAKYHDLLLDTNAKILNLKCKIADLIMEVQVDE